MKATMKYWTVRLSLALCAIGLIATGCATTKNVMNKASFGLIGGSEKPDDQPADATKEAKAERKAREKEEKQQREAEKRAAKEDEQARKAAAKEEKQSDGKPGLMSKMTFGLVGGDKESDEAKRQEADAKAAEKEQARQVKEAREQEEREAKAAKRQQEQEEEARKKEEKEAAKVEETQAQPATTPEKNASSETAAASSPKEKRTLMSRVTFGLVGGKKSAKTDAAAPSESSTPSTESTPLEPSKEEKKAQKRAEKEQREAEKQVNKDAEKAEKEQQKQAEADATAAPTEQAASEELPKEKRTMMSRMTFGLIGGKKTSESESSDKSAKSDQSGAPAEPAQPALPPEQLAMAASTDAHYDVEPASAMDPEARKLAKMSFKTSVDLSTKSSTGKGQATASRETYSRSGYGITDLGDVRIAVQGMKFDDESRGGGVIISSDDRLAAGGKSGTGNSLFNYEYAKGVSAVQFGTVSFTIAKSVINIGGKAVPIGQGKKLIVVDGQGNVVGAYLAE